MSDKAVDDFKRLIRGLTSRKAALNGLHADLPQRIEQVSGFFEAERKYHICVSNILNAARGELYNLEHGGDDADVVICEAQAKSLEERNAEGFANAILLSSDDEEDGGAAAEPAAKRPKAEPVEPPHS